MERRVNQTMIKNYLSRWNWVRIIRLIAGIWVIAEGVRVGEWWFVGLGALFALMPIMNVGCGATGCAVPRSRTNPADRQQRITFEEVDLNKK